MHRATRRAGLLTRFTAALLTVPLAGFSSPGLIFSSEAGDAGMAAFGGTVFGPDALTVLPGATVKAAHLATGQVFSSLPTGANGQYSLSNLPEGAYDLAIESAGGLFAVGTTVEATGGPAMALSFAVGAQEAPDSKEPAADEKKPEDQAEPKSSKKAKKKGGSFWRTSLGATILIVGGGAAAAVLAGAAVGSNSESMSPK